MKRLADLTEAEVLALAIANEEEDARIYATYAMRLRGNYPASAAIFDGMAQEEQRHRTLLLEAYDRKFGKELPYITRADVRGFLKRHPLWLADDLRIDAVRRQVGVMELEAGQFYARAAEQAHDVDVRRLLGDLALIEQKHEALAERLTETHLTETARDQEKAVARRLYVLQIVQPALAGLIDGSISTLAPIFAAAFATHNSADAFLVGLAASLGAGISMGLTEALSDDGEITGRGKPWIRGIACGVMTAVGGLGHTLPYLIHDFWTATAVAAVVVVLELIAIAWIRWRYMETPFHSAIVQVVLGGVLVLLTGIFIGSS
ncbi:iron exporter MbfA [Plastoroseomonas hellenica]|uniref:Rubrerythrin n=1 Tax=Plastoroseomonas hellenica TaxID=2687306 RepID=A0ABS5EVL4_9PROT|nr:ferritin family protein [Plastoroseomonas hellenica]MBR0642008.1 rubrerythrin [Plastoroseomonas hellenica]MBR0664346.1 rubrerythrin [Plastoroseomonas hellenica]